MEPQAHPVQAIKRVRISGGPHSGSTRIFDAETGTELKFVTDVVLRIEEHTWVADLTVFPVKMDIEANVAKLVRVCPNCKSKADLNPAFTTITLSEDGPLTRPGDGHFKAGTYAIVPIR